MCLQSVVLVPNKSILNPRNKAAVLFSILKFVFVTPAVGFVFLHSLEASVVGV